MAAGACRIRESNEIHCTVPLKKVHCVVMIVADVPSFSYCIFLCKEMYS